MAVEGISLGKALEDRLVPVAAEGTLEEDMLAEGKSVAAAVGRLDDAVHNPS